MNTPYLISGFEGEPAPGDWPDLVAAEWCGMHVLIEELTNVQQRLGTPLEEPEDFLRVRRLGAEIRVKLERLRPWMEASVLS